MLSAVVLVASLLVSALPSDAATATSALQPAPGSQVAACTDSVGPGIPAPANVALGQPGYHAAWYGQSGYPTLCPGHSATATVAFMNTGSLGWYAGKLGEAAFLGATAGPGQDPAFLLGGPATGWPSADRLAAQPAPYVGPGQVAWFQFTVKAPSIPGVYRIGLRPVIEGAQWMEDYGVFWYVTVKASDGSLPSVPLEPAARTYTPSLNADGSRSIRVSSLMYHYVGALPADPDRFRVDLTVSTADFETQLRYLRANGFTTITTTDLWWALDTGGPLPAKPVMLTFDDGYVDHHDNVLPLLRKYGMVGTFAVTANLVGRPGYMTRSMVKTLADFGMDVQSHAVDHVSVNLLDRGSQIYQLCSSRRILQEWTGKEVRHFIYPAGDYVPLPWSALNSCGYLSAYRKDGGSVQSSNDMYALRRYRVRGQQGVASLLTALAQ